MERVDNIPETEKKMGIVERWKKEEMMFLSSGATRLKIIFQLIEDEIKRLDDRVTLTRKAVDEINGNKPKPDYPTDKYGHRMIPGRSVVLYNPTNAMAVFISAGDQEHLLAWLTWGGRNASWHLLGVQERRPQYEITWLFDLDEPEGNQI